MTVEPAGAQEDLRRLLFVRVATGTALLVPVLYLQVLVDTERSLSPLYWLIAMLYAVNLPYVLVWRWAARWPGFVAFQLTLDTAIATMFVYALGGVRSPFVLVYLIIAFGAGAMTQQQTALAIACWAGVAYGLMAHMAAADWLPRWEIAFGPRSSTVSPPEMYLRIFSVLLATCVVAALTSGYRRRLHETRHQLRHERRALRAAQSLNEQLVAGMSSGLVAADTGGRVIACNPAAERILGRPEAEIVGRPVAEVLGLDEETLARIGERLAAGRPYRTERRLRRADGAQLPIGMSVTRVAASDEEGPWQVRAEGPMAGGTIFMFQDLTDIKRMERLFWMRERMAVLGEMAGSLAHEIRNPLASISGSLQMLRRGDVAFDSERGERLMRIVTEESERLSRIIDEFLDYARPEKLQAEETDLVALARETLELLGNSEEVGPRHELRVEADEPVHALVDPARIKQVFWNLARNALQAMPRGGTLRIALRSTPTGARVLVEDTGAGMEPAQVERIFRPFVSGSAGGVGLGLAVVYRVLQMHGARVEVESAPGRGSRFLLEFRDDRVPGPDEELVVVERRTEQEQRLFEELSRSLRVD